MQGNPFRRSLRLERIGTNGNYSVSDGIYVGRDATDHQHLGTAATCVKVGGARHR